VLAASSPARRDERHKVRAAESRILGFGLELGSSVATSNHDDARNQGTVVDMGNEVGHFTRARGVQIGDDEQKNEPQRAEASIEQAEVAQAQDPLTSFLF